MKKKIIALMGMAVLSCTLVMGCGSKTETPAAETTTEAESSDEAAAEPEEETQEVAAGTTLEDGVYTADFNTDSSMFHVNEFYEGKGTLTVENGQMTIHVVMPSTNIVNLYEGPAEDAQKDGAELLQQLRRLLRRLEKAAQDGLRVVGGETLLEQVRKRLIQRPLDDLQNVLKVIVKRLAGDAAGLHQILDRDLVDILLL